jgi:5'-nucleotidase
LKHILITNDDGYDSKGLLALIDAVKDLAKVTVVAPSSQKSACGHSLTLTQPLRFVYVDDDFYKLDDGTPTDCVYLALSSMFDEESKPDLVLSGINKGANMGEDITYSGTASAAMEAVLHSIPAIAISQVCRDMCQNIDDLNYELAKVTVRRLVMKIFRDRFPLEHRKFLNVNIPPIPPKDSKGYKITKAGYRNYVLDAKMHRNPRGDEYHWLGLHPLSWEIEGSKVMSDFEAVEQNYVSITPIQLDMTHYKAIESLESWI